MAPTLTQQQIQEIVDDSVGFILDDLTDRRGLRQSWEDIDDDIQDEIVDIWKQIIRGQILNYVNVV